MKVPIKIHARPKLKSPNLLAAWPGIGDVAMIVASYLEKRIPLKYLGEIDSSHFFDPIGVLVRDSIVEEPQFPENKFYYWKNEGQGNDFILFIGEDQPTVNGYELANCVIDVGLKFGIKRVYTCAAALTRIHHSEQSKVWGVATRQDVSEDLKRFGIVQGGNIQIAGLNGLLLGVAKERAIEGVCLLGEVPSYASQMQNPMAALSVLKVLTVILGIEADLTELSQIADETNEKIKQAAAEAMGKYIDYFTQPIWEQGEDDEEYEGEEEEE